MRLLAVLAILIVVVLGPPVVTGAESPLSPITEPWEIDLEQQKFGDRELPEGLQPPPIPVPYLEMCDVYLPGLGSVEVPCKYVDEFQEYWTQLIWW